MIPMVFYALLGAIIGSFLNVVIYRLPLILAGENLSLSWPVSHCPVCKRKINIWHNVPLLSWLWLKGRCFQCQNIIPCRYPLVELLTSVLFACVVLLQGITLLSMVDLLLMSLLIPLFFIDIDTMLLPDRLTFPFLLFALCQTGLNMGHTDLLDSMVAAFLGFSIPWLLDKLYSWRHGRAGMGMGDMKLIAGIGAWLGTEALFAVMFLSSILAIITVLLLLQKGKNDIFPFGPFLIIATLAIFFYRYALSFSSPLLLQ